MSETIITCAGENKLLQEFCVHQREIQSVAEITIRQRLLFVRPFVKKFRSKATRSRIGGLKPHDVHQYVMRIAPKLSRKYCKEFLCALRSFFKFPLFKGYTRTRLIDALPRLPTRQLSEVPRGIPWSDVQKLLAMPNRKMKNGKRNYAILLLIASTTTK